MAHSPNRSFVKAVDESFVEAVLGMAAYATLHDGDFELDSGGSLIEDQSIPEIARTPVSADGVILFEDVPQCHAQHIALWSPDDHVICRSYCFPVPDFLEWAQRRAIPQGGSVRVELQ